MDSDTKLLVGVILCFVALIVGLVYSAETESRQLKTDRSAFCDGMCQADRASCYKYFAMEGR